LHHLRQNVRISIFGLGYIGTVCAACLAAQRGNTVIGVDKIQSKVDLIRSGRSPIVERDVDGLIKEAVAAGRLTATVNAADAIASSELSLVCVGTPGGSNGALGLEAVEAVIGEIGGAIRGKRGRHVVAVRSTILPGTTRETIIPMLCKTSGRVPGEELSVAVNPEFLREGTAVDDFNNPSKIVVGALDARTAEQVMSLYSDLPGPRIETAIEMAELVKYVDNAWHALKVAFGNEIGLISKMLGIDSQELMNIFFEDKRLNISPAYLRPGFAFGGSCLPKDLRALTYFCRKLDLTLPVLDHILESNRMLIERGVAWILEQGKKRVAFLGISFKSGTDDVRESPFVEVVERLIGKGINVQIFDRNVQLSQIAGANRDYLMRVLPHVTELMMPDIAEVLHWAEVIVVATADPSYAAALAKTRPDHIVLDFSGLRRPVGEGVSAEGFLW
jgi:GDP-mannose 6-dehydrogenase